MKMNVVFSLLCAGIVAMHTSHGMMVDAFQMMQEMDLMFDQMMTRTQTYSLHAPDYNVNMADKGDVIVISLSLGKEIVSDNISVEVEGDTLYVSVAKGHDRVELTVSDQRLVINSSTYISRESQDDKNNSNHASMGSAHSSQVLTLPSRIDLHRKSPNADFVDGVLTLTFAKKGSYKIPVHSGPSAAPVVDSVSMEEVHDK